MVKKCWAALIALVIIQTFPTAVHAFQASAVPTANLVAEVSQRIETDRLQVRVYQGKQLVELKNFVELLVVTPRGSSRTIENLAKRSVAIVPSEKKLDRWEVYQDVWAGAGEYALADNVFKVKQVFISSRGRPVELKVDTQILRLKPGDALLVL